MADILDLSKIDLPKRMFHTPGLAGNRAKDKSMTDKIEVGVDADKINKFLSDAILESVIGDTIKKQIVEKIGDWRFSSTIGKAVDAEIGRLISNLLRNEFAEELQAAVRDRVAKEVVSDLAGKALDAWMRKDTP